MHQHKKDCQLLLKDLSIYLDGEASDDVCAEIEQHLSECDNCRVVVDTLNQTLHLYHTLPQPDMPEELRARLYKSLDLEPYFKPRS
jgi:anti-sigma factor (TIGR02949 family)